MVSDQLLGQISELQGGYFKILEALLDVETRQVKPDTSFAKVHATSQEARDKFEALVSLALAPAMQQEAVPEFRVAIIGSSNHGKTSVLEEMFPDLARRGLLITDVRDTTSQALMIKSGARPDLVFNPWTLDQIRFLVDLSRDDLARRGIDVQYREDHIEVDGDQADFETAVREKFRFGVRQQLKPFRGQFVLDASRAENVPVVARLTTKVDYSQKPRPQDIVVNEEAFNDLQFRVAVRSVEMGSDFSEISRWLKEAGAKEDLARHLTFIDTPGLKAGGADNDEVLRHILARKNQQIAVELLKNDELDLIVHLVLCGQQSDFASLWSGLEKVDSDVLQDLGDRIIVGLNGFNIYFSNPNLQPENRPDGNDDQFNVTIQSNVKGRLSERGAIEPLDICFLDVRKVVEAQGGTYADFYNSDGYRGSTRRAVAESWADPGGFGYATLRRLGIHERFKENVAAISDPADCGKGYLVKRILQAWKDHGPKMTVRRFVVRNRLLASIRDMKTLLLSFYDTSGHMTKQSVTDALKSTLSFLSLEKPDAIDTFCRKEVDPFIERDATVKAEAVVRDAAGKGGAAMTWPVAAFRTTVSYIFAKIKVHNRGLTPEVEGVLNQFLTSQLRTYAPAWGYSTAKFPMPTPEDKASRHLLVHALKYHAREFLHGCCRTAASDDDLAGVMQDDEDKRRMAEIIAEAGRLHAAAEKLCASHGVTVK